MIEHLTHPGGCAAALLAVFTVAAPSAGDMVVLKDGTVHAGRVTAETGDRVRMKTGGPSGATEQDWPRADVRETVRGPTEFARIDAAGDAAVVTRWAAGYFHAEQDLLAARCIRRAWSIDTGSVGRAASFPSDELRACWNRMALRERVRSVDVGDANGRLRLARSAREAGLTYESERLLRQAHRAGRANADVRALAAEWNVPLVRPVFVDLTPGMDRDLLEPSVEDQGEWVQPQVERVFLTLPVVYDPADVGRVFSRANVQGRDARGLYGFRHLPIRDGRPVLDDAGREPIYERLEVAAGADGRARLVARNTRGPRRMEGAELVQPRMSRTSRELPATGWIAAVIEIPAGASRAAVAWDDATTDAIDLDFLRRARDSIPNDQLLDPASPAMKSLLNELRPGGAAQDGGGAERRATAFLALAKLSRLRRESFTAPPPEWTALVARRVADAIGESDARVGRAALDLLAELGDLPSDLLDSFGSRPAPALLRRLTIVDEWASEAPMDARKGALVSALCGAALRCDDVVVCEAAMDVLLGLGADADWQALGQASGVGRRAAMRCVDPDDETGRSRNIATGLIAGVDPQAAALLAQSAGRRGLAIVDAGDPLLTQWRRLDAADAKASLLHVLGSVDVTTVFYSQGVLDVLRETGAASAPAAMREAAFQFVVQQSRRRRVPASPAFPLIADRAAKDAMLTGLTAAARDGTPPTRAAALRELVLLGFAEEAIRCLPWNKADEARQLAMLQSMFNDDGESVPGAVRAAALAQALDRAGPTTAAWCLAQLGRIAGDAATADQWKLTARVKAATDIGALNALIDRLEPPASGAALRWLYELGHMTPQERQRIAACSDAAERQRELLGVDLRRGRLVDGKYGVLAVLETTTCVDAGPARAVRRDAAAGESEDAAASARRTVHWRPPTRTTVALAPVELALHEEDDGFSVRHGDVELGTGLAMREPRPRLSGPTFYYGILLAPSETTLRFIPHAGPGGEDERGGRPAASDGPVLFPSGSPGEDLAPGTLKLDIGRYLRDGLSAGGTFSKDEASSLTPRSLPIRLRYTVFGGFCGTAETRPPPADAEPGARHLINVMLVLERID